MPGLHHKRVEYLNSTNDFRNCGCWTCKECDYVDNIWYLRFCDRCGHRPFYKVQPTPGTRRIETQYQGTRHNYGVRAPEAERAERKNWIKPHQVTAEIALAALRGMLPPDQYQDCEAKVKAGVEAKAQDQHRQRDHDAAAVRVDQLQRNIKRAEEDIAEYQQIIVDIPKRILEDYNKFVARCSKEANERRVAISKKIKSRTEKLQELRQDLVEAEAKYQAAACAAPTHAKGAVSLPPPPTLQSPIPVAKVTGAVAQTVQAALQHGCNDFGVLQDNIAKAMYASLQHHAVVVAPPLSSGPTAAGAVALPALQDRAPVPAVAEATASGTQAAGAAVAIPAYPSSEEGILEAEIRAMCPPPLAATAMQDDQAEESDESDDEGLHAVYVGADGPRSRSREPHGAPAGTDSDGYRRASHSSKRVPGTQPKRGARKHPQAGPVETVANPVPDGS